MAIRMLPAGGLTLAILIADPCALSAAERSIVQVSFAVAEPLYLDQLTAAEKRTIEQGVTGLLLRKLEDEIPFLRFAAGPADRKLQVRLGTPDASEERAHDVNLYLLLSGSNLEQATKEWKFRGRATWDDAITDPQAFRTEIETSLGLQKFSSVIRGLFERIAVAGEGESIHLPEWDIAWLLPFKQTELCMAPHSRVRLITEVQTTYNPNEPLELEADTSVFATAPREEQKGRILCLPDRAQDLSLVSGRPPEVVKVKEVYVLKFIKMASGCKPPQPPAAAAGPGGGQ